MNKVRDGETYINPVMRRPSALRSMLPVLLSRPARAGAAPTTIHPFRQERSAKKAR